MRECTKCKKDLPLTSFYKSTVHKGGLQTSCKTCHGARVSKTFRNRYGMSLDEFNLLLIEQRNLCAICHKPSKKTLCVDHDHRTGKVRALLCDTCNKGLGQFKDDIQTLTNALQYLKDYQ